MQIPAFLGGEDENRSPNVSNSKLVNLYQTTNNDGSVGALVATPGLSLYANIPNTYTVSGIYTASNGRCFCVANTSLFEVMAGGVIPYIGEVNFSQVTRFADNGIDMIIVNGNNGWLFNFSIGSLTLITAPAFPNKTKTVSYMNGRFICCNPGTQQFFVSDPLNGLVWDPLNVQTADSNPDKITTEFVSHNELIIFGEISGEVYYDSGLYPTPFRRNITGTFEVGCISPYSVAKIDNSVMWLGKSTTGVGIVYRLNGYTPVRMSTYSIEYEIQQIPDITDALAFTYQQEGHHFYVLTFPLGNKTFVFDVNTNMWHERSSFNQVNSSFNRWEAQGYAYFDNKHLVCDYIEGNIYSLSLDNFTDNTLIRKWTRSFSVPSSDMKRTPHHKLTIDCEVGADLIDGFTPQIMMRYSDDGGRTWSAENWRSIGAKGEYNKRVNWMRLGMTKGLPRIYEISGSDAVKTTLLGAYLE